MRRAIPILMLALMALCGCATTAPMTMTPADAGTLLGGEMISALKEGNRENFSKDLSSELKEQMTKEAFELMKSNLARLGDSIDRAEYITSLDRGGLYRTELWRVVCERKTADGSKIVIERLFYVTTAELDGKLQVLGFRFDPLV